ncbi:hypothetical protein ACOKM5_39395 [Streptomyces sp. BH097]|uniref:hypothetical protein n=1 Tax=unclassified Streptomyces TaxID=2593676 RepID=UPI003BB6F8E4
MIVGDVQGGGLAAVMVTDARDAEGALFPLDDRARLLIAPEAEDALEAEWRGCAASALVST